MKYTKIGVPVLTDVTIEAKAYSLLSRYDSKLLEQPVRIPIPLLLNYLKKDFNLEIIATSLGTRGSHRILGKTVLSKNLICFDKDLIHNETLFNFTAAHEIGHWLLHRSKKKEISSFQKDFAIDLTQAEKKSSLKTTTRSIIPFRADYGGGLQKRGRIRLGRK